MSRTTSGRAISASTSTSTIPSSQISPDSPPRSIVRPSATKTASSARLASEAEKRSISPLYGVRASPEGDAHDEDGEEARAVGERGRAVERAREHERQHRVEPFGRAAGRGAAAGSARSRRSRPKTTPTDISTTNSRTTTRNEASSWVASSIMPSISAMPAGSLTPASPSRIVPERPPTSRRPSTENITAGSVGATAAPMIPARIQSKPSA